MEHSTLNSEKGEDNVTNADSPGPGGEGGEEGVTPELAEEFDSQKGGSAVLTQEKIKSETQTTETQQNAKGNIHALLDGDLHALSRPERSTLYEAGVKLHREGQVGDALKCFLGSLTGLKEDTSYQALPQCLRGVADIYFERKEYEKAVYFIQAEKMYYETALIDITNTEKNVDNSERRNSKENGDEQVAVIPDEEPGKEAKTEETDDLSPDAKKGREFDNLAKLCLKEGKLQLALEYCGKATKMYRTVYGDQHPTTIAALDLFTVIYADVGKKLYTDAILKFEEEEEPLRTEDVDNVVATNDGGFSETELRHRSKGQDEDSHDGASPTSTSEYSAATNVELEPTSNDEKDDWVMTCLLMLIFFLVIVFIVILISSIYCYNNTKSKYCADTRGDINYWYMYLKHRYHDVMKKMVT